jgi:polynucleotide 5'-hydroxyl-kinase GRC3/NOL9
VGGFREQPGWRKALEDLQTARAILLLGATDTGKSTFLCWLANGLYAQGHRVAIVDADVGQSSLGPPTTIGLGVVAQPFESLQELMPVGLFFVGSTSPRSHLLPMLVGTKRMVDRAHTLGVDHVIVDTCGFIAAGGGQALKYYTINLLDPDVVVCLQRAHECEGILLAYRRSQRPQVLRLRASVACRRRDMEERRLYREQSWQRYFANPELITLSWDDLNLVDTPLWRGVPLEASSRVHFLRPGRPEILWMERRKDKLLLITRTRLAPNDVTDIERAEGRHVQSWIAGELHGTLLGLLDKAGETLGLGILQQIDFSRHHVDVLAACRQGKIAGIQWSRTRLGAAGELQRPLANPA